MTLKGPKEKSMKSKQTKRTEALQRQAIYEALSPAERLARLDVKLGKNCGATKERLNSLIDALAEGLITKTEYQDGVLLVKKIGETQARAGANV